MGGDDLADDFQWDRPVRGEGGGSDEDTNGVNSTTASKRRTNRNDDDDDDETDAAGPPSSKKAKGSSSSAAETTTTRALPSSSPSLVLLQAGKDLFLQSPIECATFLTTAVQHYSMMMTMTEEASTLTTTNHDDTNDSDHETTVQKPDNNNNTDKAVNFLSVPVVAQFCLGPLPSSSSQKNDENDADHSLLLRCIRHAISMKKMKQWKTVASPCVVRTTTNRHAPFFLFR